MYLGICKVMSMRTKRHLHFNNFSLHKNVNTKTIIFKPDNLMLHSYNTSKFNNYKYQQFCSSIYIFGNSLITCIKKTG